MPSARDVTLKLIDAFNGRDSDADTLKSEHLFFDQMDFLGQLGLLPS